MEPKMLCLFHAHQASLRAPLFSHTGDTGQVWLCSAWQVASKLSCAAKVAGRLLLGK